MSTLFVNNLNTASGSTITIPTGKKLIGTDIGSIAGKGNIIQQVNSTDNGTANRPYQSSSSTSFTHLSNFDLTITPSSTSSKILYVGSFNLFGSNSGYAYIAIYRHVAGGSAVYLPTNATFGHVAISQQTYMQCPVVLVDSPNTTSAVTYKVHVRSHNGSGAVYVGWTNSGTPNDNNTSYAALEIAG